jgi:hypothetical protein
VIINETISISAFSSIPNIQRDVESFNIYGSVQDGTVNLNGLDIKIILFDSHMNNVSYYLNLAGSQTINVFGGSYQFDVNSISINCPQGQYYFRIDFNGTISQPGIHVTNYMINTSSLLLPINITADTSISGYYYTKYFNDIWYQTDHLYVVGNLTWDNNSFMVGMEINVTIRDSIGNIITSKLGITDAWGGFNISFIVGAWPDDVEVWASFYPEDPNNFGSVDGAFINPSDQELYRNLNP